MAKKKGKGKKERFKGKVYLKEKFKGLQPVLKHKHIQKK